MLVNKFEIKCYYNYYNLYLDFLFIHNVEYYWICDFFPWKSAFQNMELIWLAKYIQEISLSYRFHFLSL